MTRSKDVGAVTKEELQDVYVRMTQARNPGRDIYDEIMKGAVNERCPLCGLGHVRTLDHHLPQARYTLLVVTPNNLVPSCRDCQSEKGSDYPKTEEKQTLHPYFDRFQSALWLQADVIAGKPAAFQYSVDEDAPWEDIDIARLKHHVETFGLAKRFAVQAAEELMNVRASLKNLHDLGGAQAVKADLVDRAASSQSICLNSWRSAMFRAAADSDWFCDGGFAET